MPRPAFRRLIACFIALSLGVFQAESLIADVCDGDASATERASLAGAASDLRVVGPMSQATAPGEIPSLAASDDVGGGPEGAGHGAHVCHCVHAHGGGLLSHTAAAPPSTVAIASVTRGASERTPASATPEPQLRPPAV